MEDGGNNAVIQAIIDDLRSEDVQVRVKSIKQIKVVAEALGPERTRDELLNFLSQLVGDEDIVLEAMSEELGGFVPLVGGEEHAFTILEPLESLLTAQDTKVREKAIQASEQIIKSLSPEFLHKAFYPVVKRLATADWFTAQSSAAYLFPLVYPSSPEEHKLELRDLYKKFVSDNTPAVRRAASTNLAKFITQVENNYIMSDLLPLFKISSTDEQDSVRFLSVDSCIALGQKFTQEEITEHLLPTVINLLKDSSWRVRYMVADKFVNLSKSLGEQITKTEMVGYFINLLKDSEAVVRTAASSKVTEFSELIPEELLLNSILPVVSILVADNSQEVRASLASNIMGMAPLLGKDKTISHLLDLFLKLLKDVFPEVRLNIISKLEAVNKVIGLELLSQSLLPAINELAEDPQWRVRLAIINYIPLLATQLGSDFFNEQLINLCMSWLGDAIFSIRDASINNIKKLVEIFGIPWGEANIFPRIIVLYNSETYLSRMTSLFSVHSLVPIVGAEVLTNTFLPLALRMAADPVPNIRFNVAQTLQLVAKYTSAEVTEAQIKPALTTLLEDNDTDVKYYAFMALHAIGS